MGGPCSVAEDNVRSSAWKLLVFESIGGGTETEHRDKDPRKRLLYGQDGITGFHSSVNFLR